MFRSIRDSHIAHWTARAISSAWIGAALALVSGSSAAAGFESSNVRFQGVEAVAASASKAETLRELQSELLAGDPDVDLFRSRGPFGVTIQEDRDVRVTGSERVQADLYLAAPAEKAPLVIFVHGHDSSKGAHGRQAFHVASWGMHSMTVQLSGTGPWETNGRVVARLVAAIARAPQAIDKRIDSRRIILVGHSFGAFAVAVALAENAPAAGAILLDPAAPGSDAPAFLRRVQKPVLVIGADDEHGPARNREQFYQFIRAAIAEVSIRHASHEDGQYPSEFELQSGEPDPYTTEELQVTFVSAVTAGAISLSATGTFDYAWRSFERALKDARLYNAVRKAGAPAPALKR